MAEIVILSGETQRIAGFLDEQLDPERNPLMQLLSDRLPHDRWIVLQDLLRRKLTFFAMAWLAWDATIDLAGRLGVTEYPGAHAGDLPAEIHELVWCEIPADIIDAFDNSKPYRSFTNEWGDLVHRWVKEQGWSLLELPARATEGSEELVRLENWLEERGFGEDRIPIQNLLVEVVLELTRRTTASVIRGRTDDDEFERLLAPESRQAR